MLSGQQYKALLEKTDYFGLSLYSLWKKESEDPFRNTIVKYPPPWLLQFRTGPTSEVTHQLNITLKSYVKRTKEKELSLDFHSRTGIICSTLFDFFNPDYFFENDEQNSSSHHARLEFFTDFITYMRDIDATDFPDIDEDSDLIPAMEMYRLKTFAVSDYGKHLKSSYFSRKLLFTQDYTFLYKVTLTEMLLILYSKTTEKAVCLLESYRSEFEE